MLDFQSYIDRLHEIHRSQTVLSLVFTAAVAYSIWMTANSASYRRKIMSFPNASGDQGLFGIFSAKARTAFITDCAALVKRGFSMVSEYHRLKCLG
jgi:hypothetical protein